MNSLLQSFLCALYPPLCLYCEDEMEQPDQCLCSHCVSLLELLEPQGRCPRCFSDQYAPKSRKCMKCCTKPVPFSGSAAAFECVGPAESLVARLKHAGEPFLAKTLASYLVWQFSRLNWPVPDLIVPVPLSFDRKLSRGYNQSFLIAQEFSKMIERPVEEILTRRFGDFSQSALSYKKRQKLDHQNFRLRQKKDIRDQTILLIDDMTATGATLEQCGRVLLGGYPRRLYALAVCKV